MAEVVIQSDDVSYFDSKNAPHSYSNEFLYNVKRQLSNGTTKAVILNSMGFVALSDTQLIMLDSRTAAGRAFLTDIETPNYVLKSNPNALFGFYLYLPTDTTFTTPTNLNQWLTAKGYNTITTLAAIYFQVLTLNAFYSPTSSSDLRILKLSGASTAIRNNPPSTVLTLDEAMNKNWVSTFVENKKAVVLPWAGLYRFSYWASIEQPVPFSATTSIGYCFVMIVQTSTGGGVSIDPYVHNSSGAFLATLTGILSTNDANQSLKITLIGDATASMNLSRFNIVLEYLG